MFESYIPFIIIGGIIAFIGLVAVIAWRLEKRRTEALKRSAQALGFSFVDKKDIKELAFTGSFKLFESGHSKKIKNFMQGRRDRVSWSIFDYRYTTGGGKNSHTYNQTVGYARIENNLPKFFLAKEHFFHKFAEKFGYPDIDFDSHPDFSKRYLLKSPDENVRKIFNREILDFFEKSQKIYNIEGSGQDIIIYQQAKRIKPNELTEFLDECSKIVKLFERGAGKGFQ